MRRLIGTMAIALGFGVAGLALGAPPLGVGTTGGTGIAGSSHDFTDGKKGRKISGEADGTGVSDVSEEGWNARREICRVCHIPHDHGRSRYLYTVEGTTNGGLLWNHDLGASSYTPYSSPTMDVQMAQPTGISKLCLGCHDGSVAVDAFDSYGAGGKAGFDTGTIPGSVVSYDKGYLVSGKRDGTNVDLRGTHPISIPYPAASDEFNVSSVSWIGGETVASTLEGGLIQCSTCHDVHSQEVAPGTHLLRQYQATALTSNNADGRASALCLTCHIK